MSLSLDSNVLVELMRSSKPHVRERMEQALAAGTAVSVSSVVVHELALGAYRSARPAYHLEVLDGLIERIGVASWALADALETGRLRSQLEGTGRGVGAYDTMIAGQALARGWTVVTSDVSDFRRFPGLQIIDWSDPDAVRTHAG